MRKIFNFFKRGFINGLNLLSNEFSLTIVNILTTLMVSWLFWLLIYTFYFSQQLFSYFQERLDFSIYFKPQTSTEEIEKIQKIIANFPGVEKVEYVSSEVALNKLKQESKVNPVIERALSELQINPLVDYLVVKAKTSETYLKISDYLQKSPYADKIDYLSYTENQRIIKRVISLSNNLKLIFSGLMIISIVFSGLIIFNTIYVSFYSLKEEIEVLRLLGASNWFIRAPFLFYVLFFSFLSYIIFLVTLIIFLEKTKNLWPLLLPNFSLYVFTLENFLKLNSLVLLGVVMINLGSAFLALQRHLKN